MKFIKKERKFKIYKIKKIKNHFNLEKLRRRRNVN